MNSKNKVTVEGGEHLRGNFGNKKMSFHLSMENLNLNKSCFGCESDTRYTRSIHVCSSCCHQLKDFTVSRATNEKFSIVIDDSRIDWLENNIGRSDKGKDC